MGRRAQGKAGENRGRDRGIESSSDPGLVSRRERARARLACGSVRERGMERVRARARGGAGPRAVENGSCGADGPSGAWSAERGGSTSCVLTLASSLLFPLGYTTAAQFLPTRGSSLSATRTTRTSRRSSPSRRPCGALLSFGELLSYLYFVSAVSDIFVINVINNIRIRFIISFYVICAVIYCSFCCIYV